MTVRLLAIAFAALLLAPALAVASPSAATDRPLPARVLPNLPVLDPTVDVSPGCGAFCESVGFRGATTATYHLDAWGNYRNPEELEASKNRFGFTGHLFDRETGTYYAKARYFDPELGRFLSQDSYLGEIDSPPSLHRYAYGWNRPTFWADPTGHAPGDWYDPRSYDWGAFGRDLAANADRRVFAIGGAVAEQGKSLVTQTAAMTHDTAALALEQGARGLGVEYQANLYSDLAVGAGQAFQQGRSLAGVATESAVEIGANALTAGTYGTFREQFSTIADYASGNASIEDVERRLATAAGGAVFNAAIASGTSRALGEGWLGKPLSVVGIEEATTAVAMRAERSFNAALRKVSSGTLESQRGAVSLELITLQRRQASRTGVAPNPGDVDFIGPLLPADRPPLLGLKRPYNVARRNKIPGYDDHHLDPPLGRSDPNYSTATTIPVRNDNAGGRVPGGENWHTGRGGFQSALNQHIKELGYSRTQWSALPDSVRQTHLRRYYASLRLPFP